MHLSGEYVNPELWRKVYVDHPVIRHLAQLVVWQDEADETFIIEDGKTVNAHRADYVPNGKIRVAHVLNMKSADIDAWQQMLGREGRKQLFEQIWEPIIPWEKKGLADRFRGATLNNDERNALKKALKVRGVDSRAVYAGREYKFSTNTYAYSNNGEMIYGHCLRIDFVIDPETKEITFGKAYAYVDQGSREMNAVLLEVDKAVIASMVAKDNDTAVNPQRLSTFTAAQITSLLELAIESKATRCTALLLDYKNTHFPEFADVNEFSLDW